MQVGDLVQNKARPQGAWLVTKIDGTGNWFMASDFGSYNTWLRINEYEAIIDKTCTKEYSLLERRKQ